MKEYELTEDMARLRDWYKEVSTESPKTEPQWLDAPTHDGWWWFAAKAGDVGPVLVNVASQYGIDLDDGTDHTGPGSGPFALGKWLAITPPSPPVMLPREKQVTLTARVSLRASSHYWIYTVVLDGKVINDHGGWETKSGAINACREQYGIEPTVIE